MSDTITASATGGSRIDEEDIRLTTGFADIFTAIVLVVGAGALLALAGSLGALLILGACFALGKPIVGVRQFATASYVLAIGIAAAPLVLLSGALAHGALLVAAGASALFWRSFRVPMALALVWTLLCGFVALEIGALFDLGAQGDFASLLVLGRPAGVLGLASGLTLFLLGLWYDSQDRTRETRLSDVAFWLHLVSAPLIVHSIFATYDVNPFGGRTADPGLVLGLFLMLTAVSLVIDRRPLLISSFGYLLAATAALLSSTAAADPFARRFETAALAPAVIGVFMLILAAGWTPLRRAIVALLPESVRALVPPAARSLPPPERHVDVAPGEKEPMRLVLGFNDIFVSLGSSTLFIGSFALAYHLAKPAFEEPRVWMADVFLSPAPWIMIGIPALALWLVAEYFVRIRRMAWPAITSALWFWLMSCALGLLTAWTIIGPTDLGREARSGGGSASAAMAEVAQAGLPIACAVAVVLNLLFWWRQRTPISFALAVASLLPLLFIDVIAGTFLSGAAAADAPSASDAIPRLLPAGIAVFALAMAWDRLDRARRTQRADIAFWLHLLSSLIVVPTLHWIARQTDHGTALVLAGFLALVALALATDRRAPLVVALPYVIGVVGTSSSSSAITSLLLAGGLLALILRWDQARARLLGEWSRRRHPGAGQ